AKRAQDPVAKVPCVTTAPIGRDLGCPQEATDLNLLRQVPQIALERIRDPCFAFYDPAFANPLVHFLAENLVDEPVEIGIVRKDDVTTLIPHKSVFINMGSSVAAH